MWVESNINATLPLNNKGRRITVASGKQKHFDAKPFNGHELVAAYSKLERQDGKLQLSFSYKLMLNAGTQYWHIEVDMVHMPILSVTPTLTKSLSITMKKDSIVVARPECLLNELMIKTCVKLILS